MKEIYKIINSCGECFYCKPDYYETPYNQSGYDCLHPSAPQNNRIINRNEEHKLYNYIPKWCPLNDA